MLRASIGTWINYGTSLLFQIAFANRFGATAIASAFVIAFSIMGAITGIVGSTAQTVAMPRLLGRDARLSDEAVRLLIIIAGAACAAAAAFAFLAPTLAPIVAVNRLDVGVLAALLRLGALCAVLQLLALEFGIVALARGYRFLPAAAAAIPSTVAAAQMTLVTQVDVVAMYGVFAAGSGLQVVVVAAQALLGAQLSSGPIGSVGLPTLVMVVSYALLATIVPIDRLLAGFKHVEDAAHYDYALKSLAAVQRLIVGGLMLSTLADWSRLHATGRRERISTSVGLTFLAVGLVLVLAASIAEVGRYDIVRMVYQRGTFSSNDTAAVASILAMALPGFCAEGAALVLTQALASTRLTMALGAVGVAHFLIRVSLAVALMPVFGALGVAAAYSITNLVLLVALIWLALRFRLWPRADAVPWRGVVVAIGTIVAALSMASTAARLPSAASALIVLAVFVVLYLWLRPFPNRALVPR